MDWIVILLRIIHIGSAITWAGGALLFFFYLEPTIAKLGPDAEKFVDEVVNKRKIPIYFAMASTFTVLGGALLYYHDAGGFQLWTSASGLGFTLGAVAAIIVWIAGNLLIPRTLFQVQAIGREIKAAGGPPSAALAARMHAAQGRLHMIGLVDTILIIIAIVSMAVSRYLA